MKLLTKKLINASHSELYDTFIELQSLTKGYVTNKLASKAAEVLSNEGMTNLEIQQHEVILNLLGQIDTPIGRRRWKIDKEVLEEARTISRKPISEYRRYLNRQQ